jgi:uncharacterized repeat protein (TIGR01451 family)
VRKTSDASSVKEWNSITYSFLVTNTGNVTVTDPRVNDSGFTGSGRLSAITCPGSASRLAPGEHVTCTATYTVTAADVRAGSIKNTATVTGTPPNGLTPPVSPRSSVTVTTRPNTFHLAVRKRVAGAHRVIVGERVSYQITVTNRGPDTASTPIKVRDRLPHGLDLVAARGTGWRCTVNKRTDVARCQTGAVLASGRSTTPLTVVAKPTKKAGGHRLVNVATATAPGSSATARSNRAAIRAVAVPALPHTGYRVAAPARWLA